jgi:hypothetical protein
MDHELVAQRFTKICDKLDGSQFAAKVDLLGLDA